MELKSTSIKDADILITEAVLPIYFYVPIKDVDTHCYD